MQNLGRPWTGPKWTLLSKGQLHTDTVSSLSIGDTDQAAPCHHKPGLSHRREAVPGCPEWGQSIGPLFLPAQPGALSGHILPPRPPAPPPKGR